MPPSTPYPTPQDEAALIARVKEKQDSDALMALANANTGIYLGVVGRYAHVYPAIIRQPDLADDKLFNIYRFILDYNPDKGTKLSTWISSRTDYMCKEYLKKSEKNPITAGTYGPGGPVCLDTGGDTYTSNEGGTTITLASEAPDSQVVEQADRDLKMEVVTALAAQCKDQRFPIILKYRHSEQALSWRQIGQKMGLSHEMSRKIYMKNIGAVKRRLANT